MFGIGLDEFLLDVFFFDARVLLDLAESSEQANRLDHFLFLQRDHSAGPCRSGACARAASSSAAASATTASMNRVRCIAEGHHGNSRSAGCSASRVRAFRGCDQLQQFLRIVQPLLEFGAERLCRDLRRNAHIAGQRVGSHELHFINLDGAAFFVFAQRFLDLLGNVLRLRSRNRECADQAREVFDGDVFREVKAGQSCGRQQRRKAALRVSGFERDPIEQQFIVRHAQQETRVPRGRKTILQLIPRGFELRLRAFVVIAIHPRILNEDVQAVNKRSRRGGTCTLRHVCGRDNKLLRERKFEAQG